MNTSASNLIRSRCVAVLLTLGVAVAGCSSSATVSSLEGNAQQPSSQFTGSAAPAAVKPTSAEGLAGSIADF